jgi:hypothetical protein
MTLQQSAAIVAKQQGWELCPNIGFKVFKKDKNSSLAKAIFETEFIPHFSSPAELIRVRNEVMASELFLQKIERIQSIKESHPFLAYEKIGELILDEKYPAALIKLAELITLIKKK